jgi:UDP-glucose 4-epimerase
VGGGNKVSTSLLEYTALCENATGKKISIGSKPETLRTDIPFYISDCAKVKKDFDWEPKVDVSTIVQRISNWLKENEKVLKGIFS